MARLLEKKSLWHSRIPSLSPFAISFGDTHKNINLNNYNHLLCDIVKCAIQLKKLT